MRTQAALESVRARLANAIPDMAAELYPDKPAEYRLLHPRGAFLVGYGGSRTEQPALMDLVVQDRTVDVQVTIMQRLLNGRGGVLETLDDMIRVLVGFAPSDCGKLFLKSDGFLGENGGIWQYAATFSARTVLTEDVDAQTAPLLNAIILVEDNT